MKTLPRNTPTPEQLPLIQNARPGVVVIRGAAGSGKTTVALLRLHQLAGFYLKRRERLGAAEPVRILVITFNRTLRGYIADLAKLQIVGRANLDLEIFTFAKWAMNLLSDPEVVDTAVQGAALWSFGRELGLPRDFLENEVEYLLGRFPPDRLAEYLTCKRDRRGAIPRVEHKLRQRILDEVVGPYTQWKHDRRQLDWNDCATLVMNLTQRERYDVIVADEVQDLSANQVRALMHFSKDSSSATFVLDSAQQIYPRGFTWAEAGVTVQKSHRLKNNYRNTRQICQFAAPLLDGLDVGDDGTFPDFNTCTEDGPLPLVLKGQYSAQIAFALDYIEKYVDLANASVAFLKPKGGGWFKYLEDALNAKSYSFVSIIRQSEWPQGDENIALSTMSSAKGLEFDYVFILGLSNEVTVGESDPDDSEVENLRRLLAMAITRARKVVVLGYKPSEESYLLRYLKAGTFEEHGL